MATLLVSAAVNIGVGLLLNAIFPPPDINQEGPRLTELGYTSAAYGKMVNIVFGTDRISGNIIDTTDPAIEEIVKKESESGGKGGGQSVNTTTYTYFLTCRIAWCIEGATDIIRWWGDGKIILDATGTTQIIKEGVTHTFYPGGIDQIQDPEEVARRGSDIPAYGHLTTSKVDRMPLADFANRIPNFTAEIAFNSNFTNPFLQLTPEPSGFNPPGSLTGGDTTRMDFNPDRNELYGLKGGTFGTWAADASTLNFISGIDGGSDGAVGKDAFGYSNFAGANSTPLRKHDVATGTLIESLGTQGITTGDSATGPRYEVTGGVWTHLTATAGAGVGVRGFVFHLAGGTARNGSITGTADNLSYMHTISASDGTLPDNGPNQRLGQLCAVATDHKRGVGYLIAPNAVPATEYNIIKYTPVSSLGIGGVVDTDILVETVGTLTVGVDIAGTGSILGWAINDSNGDIMFSNGTETVLYNPITDTVLGRLTTGAGSFQGRNNHYTGPLFAWISSDILGAGKIFVVNTLDMTSNRIIDTVDVGWPTTGNPTQDTVTHPESCVWDERSQAIMFSRVDLNSDAPTGARILKVFINRLNPLGVGLDTVVLALSTSYQRQKMAGLLPADVNVTTLAGDTVQGYTLNNQSTMKSALQPLRDRFLFDAHQSDWIIKFPKRGATPTVTIPEEDVGELKRGRRLTDEPALREMRQDDLSLPMSLAIRYRNKDTDYQLDVESDKRHLFPNPTMRSKSNRTLDIPLVETSTPMKQLAQKTLLTLWNERVSYKTVVPWTYIALDATDVFNMGVFGETAQIRMAENDLGQGWSIEITGVVEDTKSFSSTLAGGTAGGHISQTVPSSLPTRLFPFDAPILSLEDLTTNSLSNAYMVVGSFEDGWPGATVLKSINDTDYISTGTVNTEVALAAVKTAPSAWNFVNGDFPNRWQEVVDGGTIVLTTLRRDDVWASAANEEVVLAGGNTIGVIRASDNQVEILSFENAVVNADLTVTLTRLLRGRLGTEDIADLGITAGDKVVLLSNATNVKEAGPIIKQSLTLSELDTVLFFKGVTVGTLIEDAPVTSFAYTGRDLKPYSPVQAAAIGDDSGGLDVTWERRARGPFAAEWLDLTGEVVLNETIEQYQVTLNTLGAGDFVTKTVNDVKTANFTQAEVALGGTGGGYVGFDFLTPDGDFPAGEDPDSGGGLWVEAVGNVTSMSSVTSSGTISGPPTASLNPNFGVVIVTNEVSTTHSMTQDIDIVDAPMSLDPNSMGTATFFFNTYVAQHRSEGGCRVILQLLNAAKTVVLASKDTGEFDVGPSFGVSYGDWVRVGSIPGQDFNGIPISVASVAGVRHVRIHIYCFKRGTLFTTDRSGYDEMTLEVTVPAPGITAKIQQVSNTGLKSPIHARTVT